MEEVSRHAKMIDTYEQRFFSFRFDQHKVCSFIGCGSLIVAWMYVYLGLFNI